MTSQQSSASSQQLDQHAEIEPTSSAPVQGKPILPSTAAKTKGKVEDIASNVVPLAEPILCKEQADLVELIMSGRNVFYTGSAGCGKSTVLKTFVKRLKSEGKRVNIIAPTGRAALDINGSTSWTYAGWTPDHMKKPLKDLKQQTWGKFAKKRLNETDVLVIDEISMMENHHFERLNEIMKEARSRPGMGERAFGGVQLIVTGDFCQLPPVKPFRYCMYCGKEMREKEQKYEGTMYECPTPGHGPYLDIDKGAFRSSAWKECIFEHVNLTTVHRQSDRVFIDILERCRMGYPLTFDESDLLLNHDSKTTNAVKLFATREEVRRVNDEEFNRLRTRRVDFRCLDDFKHRENHPHLQNKGLRCPDGTLLCLREHKFEPAVYLKQGMLVVLQINLNITAGLVNGTQGVVVRWEPYDPTKLPRAEINLSRKERDGPELSFPTIVGDYANLREANIKAFIESQPERKWPVVRFHNGVERTIYADCTVNELGDEKPYSLLSRTQIPLLAARAMSIHKSQGMTLNRVVVDLSKSFEEGQMYVALSRARNLEGLKVVGLGRGQSGGNEQVKEFLWEKFGVR